MVRFIKIEGTKRISTGRSGDGPTQMSWRLVAVEQIVSVEPRERPDGGEGSSVCVVGNEKFASDMDPISLAKIIEGNTGHEP